MNEEYVRISFEGNQLEYVNNILSKYFDASGMEFYEILRKNRNLYQSQNLKESSGLNDYQFFIDKEIILEYPKAICSKLSNLTRGKNYLIKEDRQDTIIWLLYEFYRYNFVNTAIFEAVNDYNYYFFREFVRPDMLRLFKSMHSFFTKDKPFDQLYKTSKPIKIIYGNKEISLGNEHNWFFLHMKEYLDKYLEEKTIEEVDTELPKYKGKAGAKPDHDVNRIVTQLYHFLQEETPYHDPEGKKTDKICTFITYYLELLGYIIIAPDDMEFDIKKEDRKKTKLLKDWIATIRTKISENLKWEKTNGAFKSTTNEILSHGSYKENESGKCGPDTPIDEVSPTYW